jgi:ABC-type multidrug transport system fused ATPase/permease subunit
VNVPAEARVGPTAKVLGLFTRREKVRLGWLLLAVLLMGFMDVVGVSSILPFLAVVAKPDVIHTFAALEAVYEGLGFSSPNRFLFFLGLLSLAAILASNAVSLLVNWGILRVSHALGHALSMRLLAGYLCQPYAFFLDRNSTKLMLNATGEVEGVVNGVLLPGIQALAKLIIAASLVVLVFVVDPLLASFFLGIAAGAYLLVFLMMRSRIAGLGEKSQEARHARFRQATEALSGIKDLKVLGREGLFFERFCAASARYARYQSLHGAISLVPRHALEAIAFGALLLIVLYLLARNADIAQALPLMALYALTGYRLMPAFQQVYQSMTVIRFNWPSVEVVHKELAATGGIQDRIGLLKPERALPLTDRVELRAVSFRYPGSEAEVLTQLSLTVARNTSVGLVGPTGSGKTTIVDIVLGLLHPSAGSLAVDGADITDANRRAWQANIGYVPQQIYLSDDTVARNIAFGLPDEAIDLARVHAAARTAHLHEFVTTSLPKGYDTMVGERGIRLSGGQRQRIGIARALYHDPAVLVLDEATSALDGITEDAIIEAIRELSHEKTIITIAHRLSTVQDCDRIYLLERGRVVDAGTYAELAERSETFRAMAKVAG